MGVNRKSSNRPGNNGLGDGPPDQGQNVRTEIEQLKRVAIEEITTRSKKSLEINADVYLEIIISIQKRLNAGAKKYGGEMRIDDKRDWLDEAIEEALDNCVYLTATMITIRRARQWENLIGKDY
tara:strand:+ start:226 stop:597 length:372 start_codon:yes stop_codon:yes gene_type:complete